MYKSQSVPSICATVTFVQTHISHVRIALSNMLLSSSEMAVCKAEAASKVRSRISHLQHLRKRTRANQARTSYRQSQSERRSIPYCHTGRRDPF